jgi:hypothetical protein
MGKIQEPDPFGPWRDLEEFEISEAARLCAGVTPYRTFKPYRIRDREESEEAARVAKWNERLKAAAADLGVTVTPERVVVKYSEKRNRFTGEFDEIKTVIPAKRTVTRAALVAWLDSIGQRPPFFFPEPEEKPLGTRERRTLLGVIGVLAELAGFDLREQTQMHKEARGLEPYMKVRRVTIKPETLAQKLREARAEIAPKGPESVVRARSPGKP